MEKKIIIINFNSNKISDKAVAELGAEEVSHIPLQIEKSTDILFYIDEILDHIDFEKNYNKETDEWSAAYLIIPPGLSILSALVCRNLSEKLIPYNIINMIRSPQTGEFLVENIY